MAITKMIVMVLVVFSSLPSLMEAHASGRVDVQKLRKVAADNNATCILVFDVSTVDPGNNNRLSTTFYGGRPTGRFCNGRLTTDFIGVAFTKIIPGYLEPNLTNNQILHGVSFASAASGYDDHQPHGKNANITISAWIEYLLHYKIRLIKLVGQKKASEIIGNNYFIEPTRAKEFTLDKYEDFLVSSSRLVVVGVPPLGCMPLVKTLMGGSSGACVESFNNASFTFNAKVRAAIANIKTLKNDIQGMLGTGEIEFGDTCKGLTTCKDPAKSIFWDAVHPTGKDVQHHCR
ncbi:hypothetical protein MKW92_034169 [Papaver armeniacum]|nr:hypothetical protein MKW92_034169 [Papaver armeniacum]